MSPETKPARILFVDDDAAIREVFLAQLLSFGHDVVGASSGHEALEIIRSEVFDVLLVDQRMPEMDGLAVLQSALELYPDLIVVVLTAHGSIESAVRALKLGAHDYFEKPVNNWNEHFEELRLSIQRALDQRRLRAENQALRTQIEERFSDRNIIGSNRDMREIFRLIETVAPTRSTVLITGAHGTGKELIARALHHRSDRRDGAFVAVNCGALPDNLLEDELFGHVRGAFTDAVSSRPGRFAQADGGSLFLDEVGTMSPNLQVKLLRVLQEREFTPLGSTERRTVDVRIIAATNSDLRKAMQENEFREDLFYRLNVIQIHLPRLRDRRDDIPLLVSHFLDKFRLEMGTGPKRFGQEAIRCLMSYPWPGNVRQLENVVERALALSGDREVLELSDLPEEVQQTDQMVMPAVRIDEGGISLDRVLSDFEGRLVYQALESSNWTKTRAARLLNIKRTTLIEKMKRLGIPLKNREASQSQAQA
ncbi:MAG: sigma-54 dependent transcriptional regulator [Acidobacteriota bacterium]